MRLVLLTPDDSRSKYVEQFVSNDPSQVLHIEWKRLCDFLQRFEACSPQSVFGRLLYDFCEMIRDKISVRDYAGIIQKIAFGEKSSIFPDRYLGELATGVWTQWRTPKKYEKLDGTGRKLILYDAIRKAVTAEVEIKTVERTEEEQDYPWSNVFVHGSLRIYDEPVPLRHIESIESFAGFGKSRGAYRNVTHEQYRELTDYRIETGSARLTVRPRAAE